MRTPEEILKQYWNYDAFRPRQREIIQSVLDGNDTLAILPTGGGKSICFQVPALCMDGICLVISPLIALMKDQVDNLEKRGISALLVHSGMNAVQVRKTLEQATTGQFRFLYLSPERLQTKSFQEYLPALEISMLAVDESHCISQWGYDFRPSYLRISTLRDEMPEIPVLALTASATPEVQVDIQQKLKFIQPQVFRQSFSRANLSLSASEPDSKPARMIDIVNKVPGTGIVYCSSRRRTQETSALLMSAGISASFYHAGLNTEERAERQMNWIRNVSRIMACTNAFGMGIDKPDVRLVIHTDVPDCLENYYQEAGRAGRDGLRAYATLLYSKEDLDKLANEHVVRYPALDEIRRMYQGLMNYLQVASFTGEASRYSFHLEDFCTKFQWKPRAALFALKALELDGWITYEERSILPSTLVFNCNRRELQEFEEQHPGIEPLLTMLLRTYGGIFDFPSQISETLIARHLKLTTDQVIKALTFASTRQIIDYSPRSTEPQLTLMRNRVNGDLPFRMAPYLALRDRFIARAEQMISYVNTKECRAAFISNYFGETDAAPCGICDNCLEKKRSDANPQQIQDISATILALLKENSRTTEDIFLILKAKPRHHVWAALEFLQQENLITQHTSGMILFL